MKALRIKHHIPDNHLTCSVLGNDGKTYLGGVKHITDNAPGPPYFYWWVEHAFPAVGVTHGEAKTYLEALNALGAAFSRL